MPCHAECAQSAQPSSHVEVPKNESSQAKVSKRKFLSVSSKAKVPKRKFQSESSQEGSQTKAIKRKFTSEKYQAKASSRNFQSGLSLMEVPKRKSHSAGAGRSGAFERKIPKDCKRKSLIESLQATKSRRKHQLAGAAG